MKRCTIKKRAARDARKWRWLHVHMRGKHNRWVRKLRIAQWIAEAMKEPGGIYFPFGDPFKNEPSPLAGDPMKEEANDG